MRLLLAARQADLRLSLELLLSEQPTVEIVGVASESSGLLALIETSKPDMIVSDWELLVRPLATIPPEPDQSCPHLKTIVLTANNRDRQAAMEAGADAAVLKGASPDLLLQTFARVHKQIAQRGQISEKKGKGL
jgi:DNA-binding NarL/FixJ family response regulator